MKAKVRAADIARTLGISKATVSLALNGKPGVSDRTREDVFRCKEELEQQAGLSLKESGAPQAGGPKGELIQLVLFDQELSIVESAPLNIRDDVLRRFDHEAKRHGYSLGIRYISGNPALVRELVEECNRDTVAGVLLFATEMKEEDFSLFEGIRKPVVIYDNDLSGEHSCVVADNEVVVQRAVKSLVTSGYRSFVYLAQDFWMYNFEKRRIGFLAGLYTTGLNKEENPIVELGNKSDEVKAFLLQWLEEKPLPDVFLTENLFLSIALMQALRELKISVPEQVGVLGIDEVPAYMTNGLQLSCVSIDHQNRIPIAMQMLVWEIEGNREDARFCTVSRSKIIKGESLR